MTTRPSPDPQKNAGSAFVTFRRCLRDNKIFFETIAATLLGMMAIIVSVMQIAQSSWQSHVSNQIAQDSISIASSQKTLAEKQTELLDLQTKIALQEVIPQFVITADQVTDDTGFATDDRLVVRNIGGVVRELHCEHAVFLDIKLYYRTPREGKPIKKWIALNNYYAATLHDARGEGPVLTLVGENNNKLAVQLKRDFAQQAEANGMFGSAERRRYLRLKYRDMLGNEHDDFYFVPMIFGAHHLTPEEGESQFDAFHEVVREGRLVEFVGLTAEQLFEEAKK